MLANDRIQDAMAAAKAVAKMNKVQLSNSLEKDLKEIADEIKFSLSTVKKQNMIDLLRQPKLRRSYFILSWNM